MGRQKLWRLSDPGIRQLLLGKYYSIKRDFDLTSHKYFFDKRRLSSLTGNSKEGIEYWQGFCSGFYFGL